MTQAAPYQYISLSTMRQQLANRLYDASMVFWTSAELTVYVQEALRTWNALTGFWRGDFTAQTDSSTTWYDIPSLTNTLCPYTVQDQSLYSTILYHLLEPPAGVASVQFTNDDIVQSVQRRRDELLSITSCTQTVRTVGAVAGRITLPDTVIDVRRMAYLPTQSVLTGKGYGTGRYGFGIYGRSAAARIDIPRPSVLWPEDTFAEQSYDALYTLNPAGTPGLPSTYLLTTQPPLSFDTNCPPAFGGSYELLTVEAGGTLTFGSLSNFTIPDDWTPAIKWGALADLFSRESNAQDPLRAQYCVPLDSEILTRHGWKKHSEVKVGDDVMGYNISTEKCEWTPLLAVNEIPQQEVYSYSSSRFKVRCTAEHRWVIKNRNSKQRRKIKPYKDGSVLMPIDSVSSNAMIVQAAKAPDGEGIGNIKLVDFLRKGKGVDYVLRMTSGERRSFIIGMLFGEGHDHKGNGKDGNTSTLFAQNPGPVYDAMKLACALEGIATSTGRRVSKDCKTGVFVLLKRPWRDSRLKKSETPIREDVWCPTTGLGTWVMKQGDLITITGNCEQRYRQLTAILRDSAPALLAMRVNNVPAQVSSVRGSDLYNTSWQGADADVPRSVSYAGMNLFALNPPADSGINGVPYDLTLTVVENAPIPNLDGDFIQVSREDLDALLDYCVHIAMVKAGGADFMATLPLYKRFMSQATLYNRKLSEVGEYTDTLMGMAVRERNLNPVQQPIPVDES